ncbi:hypothetical protein Vadar_027153 [Vaccinium darrowii]|uniref:Uncharacterized protein n=1 Tax=Vaccinium darrowii TaxID=229202 RepID=A0ACB7YYT2_9ERIC|nr:hypothetical protein Vadar_027153 [Vaccinium darrowii]
MPLRSSSTSILNSWFRKTIESSPEHDLSLPPKRRTKSFTLTRTCSSALITSAKTATHSGPPPVPTHLQRTTSSSSLFMAVEGENKEVGPVDMVLLAVGGGGGRISGCGGGGGGGRGSDGGDGSFDSDFFRHDNTEGYYKKMIEANPGNGLLLGNYAKFLKEVRGDLAKAEEYCGRAILASPNDGNLLSFYGDLIWESKRDADRAETYFDRAVKTDPGDCYVMASYARFLWDAEEEEEEKEEGGYCGSEDDCTMSPKLFKGASHHQPLTAAS